MRKHILPFVIFLTCSLQVFAQNYYVDEDFNTGTLPTGWTNNAVNGGPVWSFGADGVNDALHSGNQDLDGTSLAYFDDDAAGPNSDSNTVELLTPTFDNSSSSQTYIEFDYNLRNVNGQTDSFYVDVYDGSNWVRVFSTYSDDCGNYTHSQCNVIPHAVLDISAHTSTNLQVRFTYHDGDNWGYYVGLDNVEVYSPYPNDLRVVDLLRPVDGCAFSGTDSIEVAIVNIGSDTASNFTVSYQIDGGTVVTENVSQPIPEDDTLNYLFNTTANMGAVKVYQVKAYTTLSTDGDFTNDTLNTTVENETSFTPTYTEDFESSDGGWTVSGSNASWAWGTPSGSTIGFAGSGNKAWVTRLGGNYNNLEVSYLTSPCLDFSATIGDPILGFLLYYHTENPFDYAWVEYSLNNGVSWTKLPGGGPNPQNWYNNTTGQVWEGHSQSWLNVENVLIGLGGEPQVKLRFAFNSDASTPLEGIGVDMVTIREPQPVDLAVNQMAYPAPGSAPLCGYGSNENIILEVENKGANAVDTFIVAYRVDNGPDIRDTVTTTLLPNTLINYSHDIKADLSGIQTYNLTVWVRALSGNDGFTPNDTLFNQMVSNSSSVAAGVLPYSESFEVFNAGSVNGQNGWTANPISTSTFDFGWRTNSGGTPDISTGPDGDHTSGNGMYAYLESLWSGGTNGIMESPCLDLSQNSGARLSFWYHRYGSNVQPTIVDVYDGRNWVNVDVINAQPQSNSADEWTYHEININAFAGRRIKIRFRASSTGTRGDQAIDDIRIIEPVPIDAMMLGPIAPRYGCDVNDQSVVTVEVRNNGSLDIQPNTMFMYYKVDTFPMVKDTFDQQLLSEQEATFTFSQTADLSIQGQLYNIKTWVEIAGDGVDLNDTVFNYRVKNNTQSPFYFEDFETARDAACDNFVGQVLPNGWYADYTAYAWQLQSALCGQYDRVTPTGATGPSGDHTTGNGYFMYTDPTPSPYDTTMRVNNADVSLARLNSPCLDLTNHTNVGLGFWYHRFGNQMGRMDLEIYDNTNGQWVSVWSVTGQTQISSQSAWTYVDVDISAYAGNFTQIRFEGRAEGARGNMAIDDISLFEIKSTDVAVTEISSPSGDGCNLSAAANVTVKVENVGSSIVPADSLILSYTNNGVQYTADTINQSIAVGGFITHTFSNTVDLSGSGDQDIVVRAQLGGDSVRYNNTNKKTITNQSVGIPYYFQDFEKFGLGTGFASNDLRGWSRNPDIANQHSWRVWQGQAPLVAGDNMRGIPRNGPSGDHTYANDLGNGNGLYMILKSDFTFDGGRPDAKLMTPDCDSIDFTQTKNGKILLSFWYHMYGDFTGDLFVDVYNGQQWINGVTSIRGAQQQSPQDPWKEKQVILDQFSNVSSGLIRFRADYIGPIGGGDIGLDDIMILDREQLDLSVKELRRPNSDCEKTNQERVRVYLQNTGTTDIFNVEMAYQLTLTPYGGVPQTFPVVRNSTITQIVPYATYVFEFTDRLDMTTPGIYSLKVWGEVNGDQFALNDTIVSEVVNTSRPFPSCEDFSGLLYGDNGNKYLGEQAGASYGIMPNFWRAQKDAAEMYLWKASMQLPGGEGGPTRGHTSGENDLYMLIEGGMPGMRSYIESPCFNLTQTRAANLEFWYQAPSDQHFVLIEGDGGGGYQIIDTLWGKEVTGWTKVTYVLADYIGSYTTFRLTSVAHGNYVAIDDFCVVPPPPQQVRVERIVTPPPGRCYYDTLEPLSIRVQNVGLDDIDSLTFIVAIDTQARAFPRGSSYYRDTFKIYTNSPVLQPAMKQNIRMPDSVNLSHRVRYYFYVRAILPGDIDTTDQLLDDYDIVHPIPTDIPYVVDFETANSLEIQPSDFGANVKSGMDLEFETGPAWDHTFQNAQGNYLVAEDVGMNPSIGDVVTITSRCMDLSKATSPELQFWYHMYGFDMGNLFISVNDDYGWDAVDSLKGPKQFRNADPWLIRQIPLVQYAGDYVRFRFTGVRGGPSHRTHIGLDDIYLFDLPARDAAPNGLARPNDFIFSCYTDTQSVIVEMRNNGSLDIDFTQDSAWLQVLIWKDGQPWDTLGQWVTQNHFINKATQQIEPLPRDSTCNIKMDSTFDMSELDASFDFKIIVSLNGDAININDTTTTTVVHQREAGQITTITPASTICNDESVELKIENFFGKLMWQERIHDENGNANRTFRGGSSFPLNDSTYVAILDTTTDLRVKICGIDSTAPVTIDVIKPFSGSAVNTAECLVDEQTVKVRVPYNGPGAIDNVEQMYIYANRGDDRLNHIKMGTPYIENGEHRFDYTFDSLQLANEIYERRLQFDTTLDNNGNIVSIDTSLKKLDLMYPFDVFVATTNSISTRNPIKVCWSDGGPDTSDAIRKLDRTKLSATVNMPINQSITDTSYKEVCVDSVLVLNAGGAVGRTFDYDWTIVYPDGTKEYDTSQIIIFDGKELQNGAIYKVVVRVVSDSGCLNTRFLPTEPGYPTGKDTLTIKAVDACAVSIDEEYLSEAFNIYPNPTSDEVFVEFRSQADLVGTVKLIGIDGKLIEQHTNVNLSKQTTKFNLGDRAKGVYFIKIETDQGVVVRKIVKS